MFNNIFFKSMYEKRWSLLSWSIAIVAMTMLTAMLFPTFKDSFGESLSEVPESMKAFFGDMYTYQIFGNFVDVQVIGQMVFLTLIMAIIFGSGFIAGDEGQGTLQSLLAQPVKRSSVYAQKYLALMLLIAIASFMLFLGVFASSLLIDESMDWWRMAQATFGIWLITMVFGSAAYSVGAFTGKRGLSGSLIGMLAFVTYLITSLAVGIDALKTVDKLSPFHYFNIPSIIVNGLDWGNVAVLVSIISIVSIVGYLRFVKRDIR
jgi:ABC-2 type transport system permease protein